MFDYHKTKLIECPCGNNIIAYAKRGILSKGRGGPFPTPKTVYAHPGFDFDSDRTEQINQILRIANMETK